MRKLSLVFCLLILSVTARAAEEGKFAQVYVNPIGLPFGYIDVGSDFAIGDNLTIGPNIISLNYKSNQIFYDITYKALGFGVRANWQFNGKAIGTGWVLTGLYTYFPKYTVTGTQSVFSLTNSEYTAESSEYVAALTFGYRWLWWGHMSLKIGLGPRYNSLASRVTMKDPNGNTLTIDSKSTQTGLGLGGDLMLGYAF